MTPGGGGGFSEPNKEKLSLTKWKSLCRWGPWDERKRKPTSPQCVGLESFGCAGPPSTYRGWTAPITAPRGPRSAGSPAAAWEKAETWGEVLAWPKSALGPQKFAFTCLCTGQGYPAPQRKDSEILLIHAGFRDTWKAKWVRLNSPGSRWRAGTLQQPGGRGHCGEEVNTQLHLSTSRVSPGECGGWNTRTGARMRQRSRETTPNSPVHPLRTSLPM